MLQREIRSRNITAKMLPPTVSFHILGTSKSFPLARLSLCHLQPPALPPKHILVVQWHSVNAEFSTTREAWSARSCFFPRASAACRTSTRWSVLRPPETQLDMCLPRAKSAWLMSARPSTTPGHFWRGFHTRLPIVPAQCRAKQRRPLTRHPKRQTNWKKLSRLRWTILKALVARPAPCSRR